MIQVLQRASILLGAFEHEPEKPRSLSELTGLLGVKAPTCANIVRTLVDLGYLDAIPGKKGYVLGPTVYALAKNGRFKGDLVKKALPFLTELSRKVGETTLLSALTHLEKVVLCQVEADQNFQANVEAVIRQDLFSTATGRLLLAYLPADELSRVLRRQGFPGGIWDDIRSLPPLEKALEKIRAEGRVILSGSRNFAGIGFPIFENGRVTASLGLYLPDHRFKGEHKIKILREMEKTSAAISKISPTKIPS
ncbi:MAG: IclR family transcriptional regulator [Spirochaetia bacterium]|nr:IclR family transcriptional regulator [Spirochaetia bacterium]